mmetsp:Transcript_71140/g.137255  ORF Transcript_71140/g.137255 Transcript_71140/m.137255 type:complete len:130 (+) Transcript_71140:182-571(+)
MPHQLCKASSSRTPLNHMRLHTPTTEQIRLQTPAQTPADTCGHLQTPARTCIHLLPELGNACMHKFSRCIHMCIYTPMHNVCICLSAGTADIHGEVSSWRTSRNTSLHRSTAMHQRQWPRRATIQVTHF